MNEKTDQSKDPDLAKETSLAEVRTPDLPRDFPDKRRTQINLPRQLVEILDRFSSGIVEKSGLLHEAIRIWLYLFSNEVRGPAGAVPRLVPSETGTLLRTHSAARGIPNEVL